MPQGRRPLWAELLRFAAKTYVEVKQKELEEQRQAELAASQSTQRYQPDINPDTGLPTYLDRFEGESDESHHERLISYYRGQAELNAKRHADAVKLEKMRMGIYDSPGRSGEDPGYNWRDCGACDGRGRYSRGAALVDCITCSATGRVKYRKIGG